MSHNGHGPIAFPSGGQIPIVGQPATLKEFCPTVLIQCNCEAKQPLLLVGAKAIKACPACKRQFTISGITWNGKTGQLGIEIGLVVNQPPAPAAPAPEPALR